MVRLDVTADHDTLTDPHPADPGAGERGDSHEGDTLEPGLGPSEGGSTLWVREDGEWIEKRVD